MRWASEKDGSTRRAATIKGVKENESNGSRIRSGITRDEFGRPSIKAADCRPSMISLKSPRHRRSIQVQRGFARSLFDKSERFEFRGMTTLASGPGIDLTAFAAINLLDDDRRGPRRGAGYREVREPAFHRR